MLVMTCMTVYSTEHTYHTVHRGKPCLVRVLRFIASMPSSLPKARLLLLVPLLTLSCLLASYTLLYGASPGTLYKYKPLNVASKIWPSLSQAGQVADHDHDEPLDLPHLRALCAATPWDPALALHCHSHCGPARASFCGGLNNARDRLQTCLRMAVDAGAATLVLPSLAARSETRLATLDPAADAEDDDEVRELCADAWFDVGRLRDALAGHCPQIQLKMVCGGGDSNSDGSAARLVGASRALEVPWRPLGGTKYDARPGHTFRDVVEKLLLLPPPSNNNVTTTTPPLTSAASSSSVTTLVTFGDTYIAWDYKLGGEHTTLFKDLFQSLTFSPRLRALGRRLVARLDTSPYIGVHLRGEDDWPAAWGSLEVQTRLYLDDIETLRLRDEARHDRAVRTIYVSCGDRAAVAYFRARAEPLGYVVWDKWSLLEGEEDEGDKGASADTELKQKPDDSDRLQLRATIEALSFDEKAAVEYEPLVRSRYFLGISYSSMSCVVATARTVAEPGDFMDVYVFGGGAGEEKEEAAGGEEKPNIHEVRGNQDTRLIYVGI